MAEIEIFELDKTLKVDGKTYNINAVQADRVINPLNIYKSNLNKKATKLIEFDGSTAKSIDIVPASGGSFAGRITVPPVSDTTLKSDGETVLNYNDIVGKVVDRLLNTSAMATWDNDKLTFTDTETPAVHGICVVLGHDIDGSVLRFAKYNMDNKILPYYLYICSDTGNIWLGDYNTDTAQQLARNASNSDTADTANQLSTAKSFIVSLSSSDLVTFDGTKDVTLGVTDTLPIDKGGTNATTADDARANLGLAAVAASGNYNDLSNKPNYAGSSTVGGAATKAISDDAGHTIATYYQPKILTGTVDPDKATVSAVKNAPNGAIYIKYTTA